MTAIADALDGLAAEFEAQGLAPANARLTAGAMLQARPGAVPATRMTWLFGKWYRWWLHDDGVLRLHKEVVPIFPDQE